MEVGALYYDLNIDDKNLKNQLAGADKSVKGFADNVSNHWQGAVNASKKFALEVAIVGAAAVAFGVSAVKAYQEAEASQAKLVHAVIGVTHATQDQLQATMALADELERKGVLDGDNIKVGLAQLSTFGLSNAAVQRLGGSLSDLAVNQFGVKASGDQLADSANMIAKALNGQFGVLEKSGIRFTEAQKAIIMTGTEMQKVDAINQGFAQNLKYTNEVARGTSEGSMAHLAVSLGNIKENIGKMIDNGIKPLLKGLGDWIDKMGGAEGVTKKIQESLKKLQPFIPAIAGLIVGGLIPALIAAGLAIIPLNPLFLAIGIVFAGLGMAVKAVIDHFGGVSNTMKALQPTLNTMKAAWQQLGVIFNTYILPLLKQLADTVINQLWPALQRLWEQLAPILIPALKILAVILGTIILASIMATIVVLTALAKAISFIADVVSFVIKYAVVAFNFLAQAFMIAVGIIMVVWNTVLKPVFDAIMFILRTLYTVWSTIFTAIFTVVWTIFSTIAQIIFSIWQGIFNFLVNNIIRPLYNFVAGMFQGIYNAIAGPMRGVWNAVVGPINDAFNWVRNVAGSFINAGANIINGLVQGIRNGAGAVINTITSICQQALSAVKRFFGIRSPSTVFAGIGKNLGLGMVEGIDGMAGAVQDSLTNLAAPVVGMNVTSNLANASLRSSTGTNFRADVSPNAQAAGAVSQTVNINEVHIDSEQTADYFFKKLSRNQELSTKALATQAGSVG